MKTIRKGSRHFDKAQHDFESLIQTAREVTPIDKLRSSQILAEAVYDDLKDFFCSVPKGSRLQTRGGEPRRGDSSTVQIGDRNGGRYRRITGESNLPVHDF